MSACWDCLDGKHTGWCKNCTCTKCFKKVIARAEERQHLPNPRAERAATKRAKAKVDELRPRGKRGPKRGSLFKPKMDPQTMHAIAERLVARGSTLSGIAREFGISREKVRTVQKHVEALAAAAPEQHPDGCVQVWLDQIEAHKQRTA